MPAQSMWQSKNADLLVAVLLLGFSAMYCSGQRNSGSTTQERILLTYPNRETICLSKAHFDASGFRFDSTEQGLLRALRTGQAIRVTPNDMLRYVERIGSFTVVAGTTNFPLPARCAIVTTHLEPPH